MVGFVKKDIATLWNVDYVQDGAQIDEQLCKDALEEVENLDFKPIFRKVYSKTLHTCRQQALVPVSGDALAKIHQIVSSAISGAHRHWEINEHSWNALKSLPGCRDQGVHRRLPEGYSILASTRARLETPTTKESASVPLPTTARPLALSRCPKQNALVRFPVGSNAFFCTISLTALIEFFVP
ncbi:hypothetical protein GQ600_10284 [Phytophthora cactorum]|nr:hypothetical protein GQ600_10284 [Phytophthora cactorum]